MNDPLVSIIIPVYKTEAYLDACVQSVLEQHYPALEIILVDDGSPDHCPALCDEYATRYTHVQVIHHSNRGLGLSRNAGLDTSHGEYVFFLDSDDRLDGPDCIGKLVNRAESQKADITAGCFRRFHDDVISEVNHHHLREGSYTQTVDFRFKGFYMYGHLAYDWGKLYRRSFLLKHDLKSGSYPFTQDKSHNMMCCACRPVYAFIDASVYLYRVNEESVTFRYKPDLMPVWLSISKDFHTFLRQRQIEADYGDLTAFHVFFGMFFLVKQELHFQKHGISQAVQALRKYASDSYAREELSKLATGHYLKQINSISWRFVIRLTSLLVCAHCYALLVLGIALLRKLKIDQKITRRRYNHSQPVEITQK